MTRRGRILVVEDDAGIRMMISIALEQAGHEVRVADGGRRVDGGDADVLVLDLRLGRRSALDLLAEQPELAALPIVLMTASGSPPALRDLQPAAMLTKPFDLEALEAAVAAALDGATLEARRA